MRHGWLVGLLVALVAAAPAHATFPGDDGDLVLGLNGNSEDPSGFYATPPVDGADVRLLEENGRPIGSTSPDGREIAFDNTNGLAIMDADGENVHNVFPSGTTSRQIPSFLADGRLAYLRRPQGSFADEIAVAGADGSGEVIFDTEVDDSIFNDIQGSPEPGIVYYRENVRAPAGSGGSTKGFYLKLDTATGQITEVASDPDFISSNGFLFFLHDVSPDGTRLLYSEYDGSTYNLMTMKVDGTDRLAVPEAPHNADLRARFSPDGDAIAYNDTAQGGMYSVDRTTGVETRIATLPSTVASVAWLARPGVEVVVNDAGDEEDENEDDDRCDADINTAEDQCTLRAAIDVLNDSGDGGSIDFDLPAAAGVVPRIDVGDALPVLDVAAVVDATTQPEVGQVEISGGAGDGLVVEGAGSEVRGLVITGFEDHGLVVRGDGTQVKSNVIGALPEGDCPDPCALGNGGDGVSIEASDVEVGADPNSLDAIPPLERPHEGGTANVIGFNAGSGVQVISGEGNTLRANDFPENAGLPIDLGAGGGVTANDPGDTDTGPNGLLNAPVATTGVVDLDGDPTVAGSVQAAPDTNYTVTLLVSDLPCTSDLATVGGRLASLPDLVRTDAQGVARFRAVAVPSGDPQSYTAVLSDAAGNTSEASNCVLDEDFDVISDHWERDGIDADRNGEPDLKLAPLGATVGRRDVFVEVDALTRQRFGNHAIARVRAAFAKAPTSNADGSSGVTLHVDNGPSSGLAPGGTWGDGSEAETVDGPADFVIERGTATPWAQMDALRAEHFTFVRSLAFHYAYVARSARSSTQPTEKLSGAARGESLGGRSVAQDFLLALGDSCTTPVSVCTGSDDAQAGVFMHELGHALGLQHGGTDDVLNKPNHLSVMNYLHEYGLVAAGNGGSTALLDYSRVGGSAATAGPHGWLPALDEATLNENDGFGGGAVTGRPYVSLTSCADDTVQPISVQGGPVNWDCSFLTGDDVGQDVNADGQETVLTTTTEWDRLLLHGHAAVDPTEAAGGGPTDDLARYAQALWSDSQAPTVELEAGPQSDGARVVTIRAADEGQLDSLVVVADGVAETVPATEVVEGVKPGTLTHTVRLTGIGNHRVEAQATDRAQNATLRTVDAPIAGPGPQPTVTPTPSPGPVVLTELSVSPKRFAVGKRSTAPTATAARGTTIGYRISREAIVTMRIQQGRPGRRSGGRCVKPTRKLRSRKRCTRYVTRVTLRRTHTTGGAKRVAFSGRVGKRVLRRGRHRIVAVAAAGAGTASAARSVAFRVVRAR